MSGSWLEELEARLEQRLEAFLHSNPQQEALLGEQEARDRQERLRRERLQLRQEAELQRQGLLRLAGEIRQWQDRVDRARTAGADDLAARAEAHVAGLMEQGRSRWQTLGELGGRFTEVERQLNDLAGAPDSTATAATGSATGGAAAEGSLDADWAAFEARQELQELRRRMQR
jgi:hercynine metabolism protein